MNTPPRRRRDALAGLLTLLALAALLAGVFSLVVAGCSDWSWLSA